MPSDTSTGAFVRQALWLRRLSGSERLQLMLEMCDESRELAASGVRRRQPALDEAAVRREVVRLLNRVAPTLG